MENKESLGLVAGIDRNVSTEAERVELIHPGVVAAFAAARARHVAQLRERLGVERPTFGAVLTRRGWAVERTAALAAVEARHVPASERRPEHAVAIHVAAARREAFDRLAVP